MKNKNIFEVPSFESCDFDKQIELISSDGNIRIFIDMDDVNQCVVEELTRLIISKINEIPKSEWGKAVKLGNKKDKELRQW